MSRKSTSGKKPRTPAQEAAFRKMIAARDAKRNGPSAKAKSRKSTTKANAKPTRKAPTVTSLAKRMARVERVQKEHAATINAHAEVLDAHSAEIETQRELIRGIGGTYTAPKSTKRQSPRDTVMMPAYQQN